MGNDFPSDRAISDQFVKSVQTALWSFVFSEDRRESGEDRYIPKQVDRILKVSTELQTLLTRNEPDPSIPERQEMTPLRHVVTLIRWNELAKPSRNPRCSVESLLQHLNWLAMRATEVKKAQQTDWLGRAKPTIKRSRGAKKGRRTGQIKMAACLGVALQKAGVAPALEGEHWKKKTPSMFTLLVEWALVQTARRTKKGGRQKGDVAAVVKGGYEAYRKILNQLEDD